MAEEETRLQQHGKSRLEDEFLILGKLGTGGYGVVYRCRSKLDRKEYAIKIVKIASREEKTMREVYALSSMDHPNVVRYYTSWIEPYADGNLFLFIQMELCCSSLSEYLNGRERVDSTTYWRMFSQILLGLSHVHQKNYVHGDLCPDNIFLDRNNNVKIGDFGLAFKQGEFELSQYGHKLYKAPEAELVYSEPVIRVLPTEINEKIDVYSLGLILAELSHKWTSFIQPLALKSLKEHRRNKKVTENVDIIFNMMAPDPSRRPMLEEISSMIQRFMPQEEVKEVKEAESGLAIELKGKKAFVTGIIDDKSYAWLIARSLAAAGADIIVGTKYPDLAIFKTNFMKVYKLDTCNDNSVKEISDQVKSDFGLIDILVHAEFRYPEESKPLLETDREAYMSAMNADAYSFVSLIRNFFYVMREGAAVISLSHHASQRIMPLCGWGKSSTMAATECDTRVLAFEAGRKKNIRVNVLCVVPLSTGASVGKMKQLHWRDLVAEYSLKNAPLGKMITGEEIGYAAAFLVSPLASAITGEIIHVDGGLHVMGIGIDSPSFRALAI